MARKFESEADAEHQLWTRLADTRAGMLWVKGSGQHPQPMTHVIDEEDGSLWFIASSDSDLVEAIEGDSNAFYVYVSNKGDYHASLSGQLSVSHDKDKLDEVWSLPAGAWFEEGKDDPKVTLLKFVPQEAGVWASEGNAVLVGLKMMNAAMRDDVSYPDVGSSTVINFAKAS